METVGRHWYWDIFRSSWQTLSAQPPLSDIGTSNATEHRRNASSGIVFLESRTERISRSMQVKYTILPVTIYCSVYENLLSRFTNFWRLNYIWWSLVSKRSFLSLCSRAIRARNTAICVEVVCLLLTYQCCSCLLRVYVRSSGVYSYLFLAHCVYKHAITDKKLKVITCSVLKSAYIW